MDSTETLSDPTDFAPTHLRSFSRVDALLRCQICKDFFSSAVITSCCHTFCSLCIRRSLAAEGKCPTCRATELESKLRRNVAIQELVDAYAEARPHVIELARTFVATSRHESVPDNHKSSKRKRTEAHNLDSEEPQVQQRRTRSQQKHFQDSSVPEIPHPPESSISPGSRPASTEAAVINTLSPERSLNASDDLVPCPICHVRMRQEAVFNHLDSCKGQEAASKDDSSSNTDPPGRNLPQPTYERLPQLNYSLFKENALRKKLSELGIPSWGAKGLLMKRHSEWINLWNANCDSARPKTRKQLLFELESWERSRGGRAKNYDTNSLGSNAGSSSGGTAGIIRKDFDGVSWVKQNKDSFDALIASARNGATTKRSETTNNDKSSESVEAGLCAPPSIAPEQAHPISVNGGNITREQSYASAATQDHANVGPHRSIDTGRRFSSPVPGFSSKAPGENMRESSNQSTPTYAPGSSGRRIVRRGSLGLTAPSSLQTESSLPDRIFKRVTSIDGDESALGSPKADPGVKKHHMFNVPEDSVVDADISQAR